MRVKFLATALLSSVFLVGCGAIARMSDWRINDAEGKNRANNGSSWVTTTYTKGLGDKQYITDSLVSATGDWYVFGYADDHRASVQGTSGLQSTARYFWNGRNVTWARNEASPSQRGKVQSEGWMDTSGLQNGTGGMVISGPYKIGDWRTYDNNNRVTTEGRYKAVRSKENELIEISVKDGIWKSFNYETLTVKTETYDRGKLVTRGTEAWTDFSSLEGMYRVDFGDNQYLEGIISEHGSFKVYKSEGSWAVGTEFWLHRSPYFNGDITTVNFGQNGSMERWYLVDGKLMIDLSFPQNYPYDTTGVTTLQAKAL